MTLTSEVNNMKLMSCKKQTNKMTLSPKEPKQITLQFGNHQLSIDLNQGHLFTSILFFFPSISD